MVGEIFKNLIIIKVPLDILCPLKLKERSFPPIINQHEIFYFPQDHGRKGLKPCIRYEKYGPN